MSATPALRTAFAEAWKEAENQLREAQRALYAFDDEEHRERYRLARSLHDGLSFHASFVVATWLEVTA